MMWDFVSHVSMKLIPMYSFLTSSSPALAVGMGRSVLYSITSGPPVLEICTPRIVPGMLELAILIEVIGDLNLRKVVESEVCARQGDEVFKTVEGRSDWN